MIALQGVLLANLEPVWIWARLEFALYCAMRVVPRDMGAEKLSCWAPKPPWRFVSLPGVDKLVQTVTLVLRPVKVDCVFAKSRVRSAPEFAILRKIVPWIGCAGP